MLCLTRLPCRMAVDSSPIGPTNSTPVHTLVDQLNLNVREGLTKLILARRQYLTNSSPAIGQVLPAHPWAHPQLITIL